MSESADDSDVDPSAAGRALERGDEKGNVLRIDMRHSGPQIDRNGFQYIFSGDLRTSIHLGVCINSFHYMADMGVEKKVHQNSRKYMTAIAKRFAS